MRSIVALKRVTRQRQQLEQHEAEIIGWCREEGHTWDELSAVTGISRETLRRRFAASDGPGAAETA